MCGIVGQATYRQAADCAAMQRALDAIAHRGPDDAGLKLVSAGDSQVILGNRRLAILDLSDAGHQPMHDPDTGNWIAYNGEVFNFAEPRGVLEKLGVQFRGQSDTEVILRAYAAWGESCIERFRGMFAIAIWDARRQCLFLCRDRLGIKPLYYHLTGGELLFSSEVRSLLATGKIARRVNETAIADYLAFGSASDPDTLIDGIHALEPGTCMFWQKGSARHVRYWNLYRTAHDNGEPPGTPVDQARNSARHHISQDDILPGLHARLREAVGLRLVSDVPVGVFLSGGIDSSALVALIAETSQKVSTFSVVFREAQWSEAQYSSAIARRFGTDHHEILLSPDDCREALPAALQALDQPSIDGVNTYFISREVRRHGFKVALSGLGSDELFAGYSCFSLVPRVTRTLERLNTLPAVVRRVLARGMGTFAAHTDRNQKLAALLDRTDLPDYPYFVSRMLFLPRERADLLRHANGNYSQRLASFSPSGTDHGFDPMNRISCLELSNYMRNTLLRDADAMSMAHGLELRVPFIDHKLVEFMLSIPGDLKLDPHTPKPLLVRALGNALPDEIVHRPKKGFTLPFEAWLRGPMRAEVERELLQWNRSSLAEHIEPRAVREVWMRFLSRKTWWSRPWALYVLSRWVAHNQV